MPDVRFASVFGLDPTDKSTKDEAHEESGALATLTEFLRNDFPTSDLKQKLQELSQKGLHDGRSSIIIVHDILDELNSVQAKVQDYLAARYGDGAAILTRSTKELLHTHWQGVLPSLFEPMMESILYHFGTMMLHLTPRDSEPFRETGLIDGPESIVVVGQWTSLLRTMHNLGLLEYDFMEAMSEAVMSLLHEFIQQGFGAVETDNAVFKTLYQRMEEEFFPLTRSMTSILDESGQVIKLLEDAEAEMINALSIMATSQFGVLRSEWLCHSVLEGQHEMESYAGAMADLQVYMSNPNVRAYMVKVFQVGLKSEVLHAGRSTVEILEIYVRIITVLKVVDPSGVVLRRVSEPIKAFLRARKDAVTIILNSLLESSTDNLGERKQSSGIFCAGVAECMEQEADHYFREYYEGSDLWDPEWRPEPIDAASGHHAIRNLDAMAHLVSLEHRDTFIRELQNVLASRLLSKRYSAIRIDFPGPNITDGDFGPEIRLLNVFKQRFTELHLQSSEIMLRDVLESEILNARILTRAAADGTRLPKVDFQAVVLSRFYWPSLRDEGCKWAPAVEEAATHWSREFGRRRPRRRLEWLRGLGTATVELELEDRKVVVECTTWQAAVIQAFQSSSPSPPTPSKKTTPSPASLTPSKRNTTVPSPSPITRTITELTTTTTLEESLVRAACAFWTGKLVLRSTSPTDPDSYTVLERLPSRTTSTNNIQAAATAAAHAAASASSATVAPTTAAKSGADLLAENGSLYASFVVGMLTNQGAMKAGRVLAMLRMAVPGGFPFEEGELVGFLGGLVEAGKLERAGGLWRIKKG